MSQRQSVHSQGDIISQRVAMKAPVVFHPTNTFQDGNVVVIAGTTEFRLYRGLLARHSTFFSDIFEDPYPPKGAELIGGIPVVRLDADASVFDTTLSILMGDPPEDPDVKEVESILELSWKYQIALVKKWGRETLIRYFPTTEADWDADLGYESYAGCYSDVISIGLRFDVPEILPLAMYAAAVEGETLRLPKDMETVLQVVESGRARYRVLAMEFMGLIPEYGILERHNCRKGCTADAGKLGVGQSSNWMIEMMKDPLTSLSSGTSEAVREKWCKSCTTKNDAVRKQLRTKLFNKLPGIFRVDYALPRVTSSTPRASSRRSITPTIDSESD